jgi:hypothetical protein
VTAANPLHVVVSSPSSIYNSLLPLLGLVLGALLTYWLSGAASRRLRRNEQRFVGYVAIQRFLISTCEQAEFDAISYKLNPPQVQPALDVIGPEAQAVANLVASRRVLDTLNVYTSTLRKQVGAQRQLNAMVLTEAGAGTEAERTAFSQRRRELVGERDSLLLELKKSFGEVNAALRKDLNIEAIDWAAYENSANPKPA